MKTRAKPKKYVYCIFYLENDYYTTINDELADKGYNGIKAIIPTIRILRKVVHGRDKYEVVPLLFNYAFLRMPLEKAYSREFLNNLRRNIRGIRSWLKSPESLHPKKVRKRIDNPDIFDDFSLVALATKKEVRYFQRLSRKNKHILQDDLIKIKPGDYITLNSYPYDGVDATVIEVNRTNKTIKLLLYPQLGKMEVTLPFDQVISTVYSNYDPEKLSICQDDINMSTITAEAISRVLDLKQY